MTIYVEVYPDRYILQPGDVMEIASDPTGAPFHIEPSTGSLTIFPGNTAGAAVKINGNLAEPDWQSTVMTSGGPDKPMG